MKKLYCFGKEDFCDYEKEERVSGNLCGYCEFLDGTGGEYRDYPVTNADFMRAMDDEELAENRVVKIIGLEECPIYIAIDFPDRTFLSREYAVEKELKWLKEVKKTGS